MGIFLSLASAFCFGTSDLIVSRASTVEGSVKTQVYSQTVGLILSLLLLLLGGFNNWDKALSLSGVVALAIGLSFVIANLFLFRALSLGPLLLVSPISSSFAAITVLLSILTGDKPTLLQLIGIFLVLIGAFAATATSIASEDKISSRLAPNSIVWPHLGILFAVISALIYGVNFWVQRYAVSALGAQYTVFLMRVTGTVALTLYLAASKKSIVLEKISSLTILLPIGALTTFANLFYSLALGYGITSIVSVIVSLYSVVTIILGYVFLKQRLGIKQGIAILLTLMGLALTSL